MKENKNKLTIIILSIALVIAVLAILYFTVLKDKVRQTQTQITDQISGSDGKVSSGVLSGKKEFTDASGSYSIKYPKDNWIVIGKDKVASGGGSYDVAIVNSQDPKIFMGINGPVKKDKDYEKELDNFQEALIENLTKKLSENNFNIEILEKDNGKKNNYSFIYLVAKNSPKDDSAKSIINIQKNIISPDKIFVLTGSAPADKYDANKKTITEIIDSFTLK